MVFRRGPRPRARGGLLLIEVKDRGPLRNEVCEGVALDCVAADELDVELRQFHSPLGDAPGGVTVAEHRLQRALGDDLNGMRLEIMA